MKTYKEELQEFVAICEYIEEMEKALLYHSDLTKDEAYKRLYDKVFSDEINGRLQKLYPFDWCDIDAGYDDDYLSWRGEMSMAVSNVRKMLEND